MSSSDQRSWGRFAASMAALVAVVVGIPAFLVTCSRMALGSLHPIPGIGSADDIQNWVERELSTGEMVPILLRSLLVIGWALWFLLLWSVIVAVLTSRPRFSHVPLPSLPVFQGFAVWIATGLTTISSFAPNLPAVAAAQGAPPVPSSFVGNAIKGDTVTNSVVSRAGSIPAGYVRVGTGDSLPAISQRVFGDTERWSELWDLRDQQRDNGTGTLWVQPWRLEAGWLLKVPAGVDSQRQALRHVPASVDSRVDESPTDVVPNQRVADAGVGTQTAVPNDWQTAQLHVGADPSIESDDHVVHMVVEGDTLWDIAGDQMGDEQAWPQIWDENQGADMGGGRTFDDPDLILPGWELEVPTIEPVPAGAEDAEAPSEPAPSIEADEVEAQTPPDTTIVADEDEAATPSASTSVEAAGDTAGDTTTDTVASTDADEAGAPSTAEQNDQIPTTESTDDAAATTSQDSTATTVDPASDDREMLPTEADMPAPVFEDSDAVADRVQAGSPVVAGTEPSAPTTTIQPSVQAAGDAGGSTRSGQPAPKAPAPLRLEHGALLAAGILTLVAVRRRRALRAALPHARVPAPPADVAATERRLRTIDPGERATRLDVAVRAASYRIAETGVGIGTVRVAPDGAVVMRLTGDAELDAPWIGEGATWTLPAAVPVEMFSDDARRVGQPCLALVTVGIDHDGRDVLIDLEAAGISVVEAQSHQADEVVRAIGSGLATSLNSEVAHLVVAGLGVECLFDHPNGRQASSTEAAVEAAMQLVGSTVANERSSFDLRVKRTGGEMWEPAVVLLSTADGAETNPALTRLPGPGHGIATVTTGTARGLAQAGVVVGARLTAHSDRWVLDAFGEQIDMTPIGVSDADVEELGNILADAELPIEPAGIVHVDVADEVGEPLSPLPHEIVVSLMGGVEVTDRNGQPGSFERSKTVELIAWLATHRERATRSSARTALWEMDVRDATFANVVSEARRGMARLVGPPDGGEWLARTLNESLPLHELVVTDADLIRQRVHHAQMAPPAHAIDVLRPAVAMIRHMPFAGTSYLWPDADGITSNLVLLATTAAAELAAHALSVGDTELVFWSTGQGLKVLPGHEELIGLRMRAHARAGDLAGVRQEWESYERTIMADSWSDGEPAPKLLDLRRQLLSPNG